MTIKKKLLSTLLLNISLIAGLGFFGYYNIEKIHNKLDIIATDSVSSIIKVNDLSRFFLLATENILSYNATGAIAEKEAHFKNEKMFYQAMGELRLLVDNYSSESKESALKILSYISKILEDHDIAAHEFLSYDDKSAVNTANKYSGSEGMKVTKAVLLDRIIKDVDAITPLLNQYIDQERTEVIEGQREAEQTTHTAINIAFFVVILSIIIFLGINWMIISAIINPLSVLENATINLGMGDLSTRVKIKSRDEFGILGGAFNIMASNIEQAQSILELKIKERTTDLEKFIAECSTELKTSKSGIEETVSERTAELEGAKLKLENIIAERTIELRNKIAELEKTNSLMMGREVRISELKKEVEELRSKLNNA